MGTPVLTLVGGSFASRMAAALLHALNMDELITESVQEYEQRIIALANDKVALSAARNKLKQQKETTQILSSQKVVKDIEATYLSLLN
jgi:predicted O-linked N-acetylglucosamine transferase (SPINDLY family)